MSLQSLANQHRQAILARETLAANQITGAWHAALAGTLQRLSGFFSQLSNAETPNLAWLVEAQRLQRALDAINGEVSTFSQSAAQTVQGQAQAGQQSGVQDGRTLLHEAIGVQFGQPMIQAQTPLAASLDTGYIANLFARLPADMVARAKAEIMQGVLLGWGPRKIASRLQYILHISLSDALRISRTEAMQAYRSGTLDIYRANSDVVTGWEWLAAAGACPFCESMNGSHHSLGETLDSHPNCRCTMLPDTRSYEDILAA